MPWSFLGDAPAYEAPVRLAAVPGPFPPAGSPANIPPERCVSPEGPMAKSNARTVQEYLDELPDDRRPVVEAVRKAILKALPQGYREAMNWGVINYEVPLERFPDTHNGHPLTYVGLSAQKNYYVLYLMSAYADPKLLAELQDAFKKADKKLDMGACCVRFRKLDDLPLEAIGRIVARVTPAKYIEVYKASRKK
jgi:hypothetical protein